MTTIGLISDTHDYLDPRVTEIFSGVEHILHAGDVCRPEIILALEAIAPVTVVAGNNDFHPDWRPTEVVELAGIRALIHHIVDPTRLSETLAARIEREQPRVVLFGHSHVPYEEERNGVLFVNPGYAGRPRFRQRRSMALLRCEPGRLAVEFRWLD